MWFSCRVVTITHTHTLPRVHASQLLLRRPLTISRLGFILLLLPPLLLLVLVRRWRRGQGGPGPISATVVVLLAALGAVALHEDRVGFTLAALGPAVAVEPLVDG